MDEQLPGTTPPQDQPEQPRQEQQPPSPPPPPQQQTVPPQQPWVRPMPPSPAPTQSGAKRYWWIPVSCAVGCLPWFLLAIVLFVALIAAGGDREPTGSHVALIRVDGVITGGGSSNDMWGGSTSGAEDIIKQLERARKSDRAKVIVLRIDSPGGSAAGSEEVYNEIMRIRKSGKPVYTSMGDIAASGGYYIASACDKIYCDYNTLTGSIGVIFSLADMSELYRKIGYKPEVVKSGKYKDIGSSARPLTADERKLLQGIITSTYEKFLSSVAEGRGQKAEQIRPIADGRIFTGAQALKLKLVDQIGGLHETVQDAARAGGISGEPDVVEYRRRGFLDMVLGSASEGASSRMQDEAMRRMAEELLRRNAEAGGLR